MSKLNQQQYLELVQPLQPYFPTVCLGPPSNHRQPQQMGPWQGGDLERNYLIDWCDLAEHWRVGNDVKSIMSGWLEEGD